MAEAITSEQLRDLLGSFREAAFYLETRDTYALDYETDDFARFLAGDPQPPTEISWWRPWLDQIRSLTQQGKQITRVRVLAEPPSDYQRWGLWALPWHVRAGERVMYMGRREAARAGLPLGSDWWLLDSERVIVLRYTGDGHLMNMTLVTDVETVAQYREWRDLAIRHATPAEQITAA